ncbi:MAG: bifunctional 3,4-dihydroxy-2-butanone-4-phosphate synthase/GTP cyclohydrolase II [Bacteroidetes bacterium]|nr:bifunctional 3,4-dihydroxy-2-butanone-4-phosphate synthase/GTP cyclohydrolase II [Bacteroidota bacterium]
MFNTIEEAIYDLRSGKMIIVTDDEDRENEGDLVMAAEAVKAEDINFMVKHGGGLICLPVIKDRLRELNLDMMVESNTDSLQTAFTVSIDSADAKTGISAHERAETIQKVLRSQYKAGDFTKPGHIFPLAYKEGGVLRRAGHTEAAVDLAKLAGFYPAGVICEIMNEDGSMARVPDLIKYKEKHDLKMISIADLIQYRRQHESMVELVSETKMPTKHGDFIAKGFVNKINGEHHIALCMGDINTTDDILVRVHSECLTGDAFGSERCDCGDQLDEALYRIAHKCQGVLLYMRQEGRGIGLINKLKAYHLQDQGMDTVEANHALGFHDDLREYGIGAEILYQLGVRNIRLMTNNPQKVKGLEGFGLNILSREPIIIHHNQNNKEYLETKVHKMGHLMNIENN